MEQKSSKPICPKCKKRRMVKNGRRRLANGERIPQWLCRSGDAGRVFCYATTDPTAPYRDSHRRAKEQVEPRKPFRRKIDTSRWLAFTAAQNATPTHPFFKALKVFTNAVSGELCVIPIRYKNATSVWTASQRNAEYWLRDVAEEELGEAGISSYNYYVKEAELFGLFGIIRLPNMIWEQVCDEYAKRYLYEQRKKLNNNLVVCGDIKIQPTRDDPISTFKGLTQGESGIMGHTKLRLECVATPQNRMPKILTTTGACTVSNYTDTASGKAGEFHHVQGAVIVEIVNSKKFHLYHVNARGDGAFIFIDTEYHPDGTIKPAERSKALILGDAHYRFADPAVVDATFGKDGLTDIIDPETLVWHDLLDCYWGNPHHVKSGNPFIKKAKHDAGFHVARDEVVETIQWMEKLGAGRKNLIVASNHDNMFERWIVREDWKEQDPDNMEFYLETALQMVRSAEMIETGATYLDPFGYWVNQLKSPSSDVTPLLGNQAYSIGTVLVSLHGDKGPKGAKGTIKNFAKIGAKTATGHGHSPAIYHGHWRAGTMTRLSAEYTGPLGDWMNAHISLDAWDKRHLHFCIDGSFGFGIN